ERSLDLGKLPFEDVGEREAAILLLRDQLHERLDRERAPTRVLIAGKNGFAFGQAVGVEKERTRDAAAGSGGGRFGFGRLLAETGQHEAYFFGRKASEC